MPTTTKRAYFICEGDIRGRCPHKHRTHEGAAACLEQDRQGCSRQGGYSDRAVYECLPGERKILDLDDLDDDK